MFLVQWSCSSSIISVECRHLFNYAPAFVWQIISWPSHLIISLLFVCHLSVAVKEPVNVLFIFHPLPQNAATMQQFPFVWSKVAAGTSVTSYAAFVYLFLTITVIRLHEARGIKTKKKKQNKGLIIFMNGWCGNFSFNQQSSVCLELTWYITNAVIPDRFHCLQAKWNLASAGAWMTYYCCEL